MAEGYLHDIDTGITFYNPNYPEELLGVEGMGYANLRLATESEIAECILKDAKTKKFIDFSNYFEQNESIYNIDLYQKSTGAHIFHNISFFEKNFSPENNALYIQSSSSMPFSSSDSRAFVEFLTKFRENVLNLRERICNQIFALETLDDVENFDYVTPFKSIQNIFEIQ